MYNGQAPPDNDELEVHIFGRGYGEAIAVHIGNGYWIAVDSALTESSSPWVLGYLSDIGVSADQIRDLIITHWHTDHIKGAAKILSSASAARLILSNAGMTEVFLNFVANYSGSQSDPSKAAAFEIHELYKIIKHRYDTTRITNYRAVSRNMILTFDGLPDARMLVMSPSELDTTAARSYFASLGSPGNAPAYVPEPENHASLVLLLTVGNDTILLGGDRENHASAERGWTVAITAKNELAPDLKASAFKVPHHGSDTAYCPALWPDHVSNDCINIITPYVRLQTPLPRPELLDQYKQHSPHLYCTSIPRRLRARFPLPSDAGPAGVRILASGQVGAGSVRLRKPKNARAGDWSVHLFGAARKA